jgi:hypothetical protein
MDWKLPVVLDSENQTMNDCDLDQTNEQGHYLHVEQLLVMKEV